MNAAHQDFCLHMFNQVTSWALHLEVRTDVLKKNLEIITLQMVVRAMSMAKITYDDTA